MTVLKTSQFDGSDFEKSKSYYNIVERYNMYNNIYNSAFLNANKRERRKKKANRETWSRSARTIFLSCKL